MLEKFRQAKLPEIRALQTSGVPEPWQEKRSNFAEALKQHDKIAVIAEYKRASPSRGVIRHDLAVNDVAQQYAAGGASALSILTEEKYFNGNLAFLAKAHTVCKLPLLRKDFIFDELQIAATAATPASALLLIARMLPYAKTLRNLREMAESFALDAVVEIFSEADLQLARDAGAKIIQVNARDLKSLKVDRQASLELIKANQPQNNEIWIAASGISGPDHLAQAQDAGYAAALVGTALMEQPQPGAALANLLEH